MPPSRLALSLLLASSLFPSCAKMPTAPKVRVPVSGTIQDRNGNGIQAVYVIFVDAGPTAKGAYPASYLTVTDLNGSYSGTIPDGRYNVIIWPPASSAYAATQIASKEVGRSGLRFDYRLAWSRVAIHPFISGGQASSALRAHLYAAYPVYVDFRLRGNDWEAFVPPGVYHVVMDLGGIGFGYPRHELDAAVSADTSLDVRFNGNAVSAHITSQGGAPLGGARFAAVSNSVYVGATADAGGAATLYVPSDTYRLIAKGPLDDVLGRTLASVPISGDASFDFDLSGIVWTGVVRRASDGSAVTGALVEAYDPVQPYMRAISTTDANGFHFIVRSGVYYRIEVYESRDYSWDEVGHVDSVPAGADSTFDILVNDTPIAPSAATVITPTPPAGRDAPASAAAGRGFPRRSSRTSE